MAELGELGETYQRYVTHAVNDYPLMLGRVLCYTTKMGLDNMIAIEEGHLPIRLDPYLINVVSNLNPPFADHYTLNLAYCAR